MKIINKEVLWEGKFLRIVLISFIDKEGKLRKWEAVERINSKGIVIVIPITPKGEFVFIRQFRPAFGGYVIEFPAGLNDKKETLIEVAKRELIEETGLLSDEIVFLAEGPVSSGLSTEVITVYVAKNVKEAGEDLRRMFPPDDTESIEVLRIPHEKAFDFLEEQRIKGDFIDLKIYGFIELARKYIN
ncbi:MAG: NUDIX hydrolase [Thermodesulfovibrio sp.]|nr:NUDIX hydrolase [Thermodesulfovibrio sp.]